MALSINKWHLASVIFTYFCLKKRGLNCLLGHSLGGNTASSLGVDLLVQLSQLEGNESLQEAGSVVGSRGVAELQDVLSQLSVELGSDVAQVALHVDELLEVVELAIHLEDGHLIVEIRVGAVGELDARVRAGQLATAGHPRDGAALIKEVAGVEVLHSLLLHETSAEDLSLLIIGDELGGEHLQHNIRLSSLGSDEGIKVGLAGLDGGLDGLKRVSTLHHIALDLPCELDLVTDVKVDGEVQQLADAVIHKGVEALDDDDGGGLDGLGLI